MPGCLRKFVELNPVLVRGVLVAVAALLAQLFSHTVIEESLITTIIDTMTAFAALITALWARGSVIAENKVIAWKLDPADDSTIVPGLATIDSDVEAQKVIEASFVSKNQKEVRREYLQAA